MNELAMLLIINLSLCHRLTTHSFSPPAPQGTVSELLEHGMMVTLSGLLKGLVPKTHLSDILLRNPEKKYKKGMMIKCRVSLSVDVCVCAFVRA